GGHRLAIPFVINELEPLQAIGRVRFHLEPLTLNGVHVGSWITHDLGESKRPAVGLLQTARCIWIVRAVAALSAFADIAFRAGITIITARPVGKVFLDAAAILADRALAEP